MTINGKAELVVQDAASYQRLIELARRAEDLATTRRAVTEADAGLGRPVGEMLAEMKQILAAKQGR